MHSVYAFRVHFLGILCFLSSLIACEEERVPEIEKIVCSFGPHFFSSVELGANGQYFYAGFPTVGEEKRPGNLFGPEGQALSYYYSAEQGELFQHFKEELERYDFQRIKAGNYGLEEIFVEESLYYFCVYYDDGSQKCLYGNDFPNHLNDLIQQFMDSHQSIKLNKVSELHIFETAHKVYIDTPSEPNY